MIAFGQKLGDALLNLPRFGGINLHSSLLPKYRGAAPSTGRLNNDPQTGVTVLRVSQVMDGGDILSTLSTPIGPAETAGELHDRLAFLGAPLVVDVINSIEDGSVRPMPQDASRRSPAPKLSRQMAWVDFSQPAALVSARFEASPPGRAAPSWSSMPPVTAPQATIIKCQVRELASPHDIEHCGVVLADRSIACGSGSIELLSIQPSSKKIMDAAAFANGYGLEPGAKLFGVQKIP